MKKVILDSVLLVTVHLPACTKHKLSTLIHFFEGGEGGGWRVREL